MYIKSYYIKKEIETTSTTPLFNAFYLVCCWTIIVYMI